MTRFIAPLAFLVACAQPTADQPFVDAEDAVIDDGTTAAAGTSSGTDTTPEGTAFQPVRGQWGVLSRDIVSDDCNLADYVTQGEPGSVMMLGNGASDDRFVLDHSDGTEDNCIFTTEFDYDCLNREDVDDTAEAIGATIILDVHSYGGFDDSETMYMDVAVNATCQGGGCFLVEMATGTFPCYLELSLEFSAL